MTTSGFCSTRASPGAQRTSPSRPQSPNTAATSAAPSGPPAELNGYLNFPGVAQVFAVRRETVEVKSAKRRIETAYGVTSLDRKAATPQRLLTLNRGHWTIEATHHILDWSFDEDRSRIRTGYGPENMTRLRALRHRPHQGARDRRRRNHAQSGQEPAPGPRLPEDDRERQPTGSARLTAPRQPPPSPHPQPPASGGSAMPGCRNNRGSRSKGIAIGLPDHD